MGEETLDDPRLTDGYEDESSSLNGSTKEEVKSQDNCCCKNPKVRWFFIILIVVILIVLAVSVPLLILGNKVPATWSDWKSGGCSASCGPGLEEFLRTCSVIDGCGDNDTKVETCNLWSCGPLPLASSDELKAQIADSGSVMGHMFNKFQQTLKESNTDFDPTVKEVAPLVNMSLTDLYDLTVNLRFNAPLQAFFVGHIAMNQAASSDQQFMQINPYLNISTPAAQIMEITGVMTWINSMTLYSEVEWTKTSVENLVKTQRLAWDFISESDVENKDLKVSYEAQCINRVGIVYQQAGNRSDAIPYYNEALSVMDTLENPQHYKVYASIHFNKGTAFYYLNQYAEAIEFLNAAKEYSQQATDSDRNDKYYFAEDCASWIEKAEKKLNDSE